VLSVLGPPGIKPSGECSRFVLTNSLSVEESKVSSVACRVDEVTTNGDVFLHRDVRITPVSVLPSRTHCSRATWPSLFIKLGLKLIKTRPCSRLCTRFSSGWSV